VSCDDFGHCEVTNLTYQPLAQGHVPEGRIELPTQFTAIVSSSLLGVCGIGGIYLHRRCYDFCYDFSGP
jgi:hypothetical protein